MIVKIKKIIIMTKKTKKKMKMMMKKKMQPKSFSCNNKCKMKIVLINKMKMKIMIRKTQKFLNLITKMREINNKYNNNLIKNIYNKMLMILELPVMMIIWNKLMNNNKKNIICNSTNLIIQINFKKTHMITTSM